MLAGINFRDLERSGAGSDRIDLAVLVGGGCENGGGGARHLCRQQHRGFDRRYPDNIIATGLDRGDQFGRKGAGRNRSLQKIGKSIDCGPGIERFAVLEFDALAQFEFPHLGVGLRPGFSQTRLQFHVVTDTYQALETSCPRAEISVVGRHLPAGLHPEIIVIGNCRGLCRIGSKRGHDGACRPKCVLHHRIFPFYF
ncbi:hypothetical protein D3C80_908320 [compost metagenome]